VAASEARRARGGVEAAWVAAPPATLMVVGFVRMQLVGASTWTTSPARDREHRVEQGFERDAVVDVRAGQEERERDAAAIRDEVTLGTGSATVRRVRSGCRAPLLAASDALSTQAGLQSIRSASRRRRRTS